MDCRRLRIWAIRWGILWIAGWSASSCVASDAGNDLPSRPAALSLRPQPTPLRDRAWFLPLTGALYAGLAALAGIAFHDRRKLAAHARALEARAAERTAELTADIERRRRAEAAAREGEERFSKAFQASPIIAAITTYPAGIYTDVNRAFTDSLEYALDEVLGRTALQLGIWPRPEQRAALIDALERGETVRGVECLVRSKSGKIRTVLTSVERIHLSGQAAMLFVSLDITERIVLESKLRQAHKMEAVGLLSGGIAHDFNNILGAILGNAQMAAMDLTPGHPASVSLGQIIESSRRATTLVRQILAFARQEPLRKRPTDLRPAVEESIRFLRATIPAAVAIHPRLPDTPCFALADDSQVHQSLVNLATNAWHALENGPGVLGIELVRIEAPEELLARHPDLKPGAYCRLSVEDNGKGMDAATLERIFDPFFTTKDPGSGTGLGLSVVHGIVHAHDGAIDVRSTPGVGTRFDLYFPAADVPAEAPVSAPPSSASAVAGGLRRGRGESILFVDDEVSMVRTFGAALRRFGYRVTTFTSAGEALEALRRDPTAFHLVITDYSMPHLSGIDVALEAFHLRPGLPLLLTSGFVSEQVQGEIKAAGIRHTLRKPSSLEELSEAVHEALHPTNHDESPSTRSGG